MTDLPPPTTAPAGWYPDPEGSPIPRYFDGRTWAPPTGHACHGHPSPGRAGFATVRPANRREPHSTLPLPAAVGALVILLGSLVGGRLLIDVLVRFDWPVLVYVAILTTVGYGPSVAWCWYVSRRWGTGRLAADIGLRFRWSDLGWGPVIWIAAVISQIIVAAVVLVARIPTSSNTEGISEMDADRSYVIALLVTAVIAAPVVEEMVFRGVVLRGFLGRMAAALAIGLQAVLFGLVHFDPVRGSGNIGLVLILSAVGAALGVAAFLLRRIGSVILAHAIFNGVVLAVVLTGFADRLQDAADRSAPGAAAVAQVDVAQFAVVTQFDVTQIGVVDQADTVHPGGDHEQAVRTDQCRRTGCEGVGVDHRGVLHGGERFVGDR